MEMRHQLVFLMIACAIKYMYVSAQRIPPIKKAPPKPPPLFYPASSYLAIDGGCLCNDSICIYEAMKTDLYDTSTADLLQLAFFTTIPFFDSVRITTNVNFTIFNTTENSNVVVTWIHQWFPYTSIGVLRKVFPAVIRGTMDPWSALPVFYEIYQNDYFIPVTLTISLNCTRSRVEHASYTTRDIMDEVKSLWGDNMQWAKSYARYNGPVPYPNDNDRGIAYDVTTFTTTDTLGFALFCSIYVLFNIAVAIMVMSTSSYAFKLLIDKNKQTPYVKSIFWSAAGCGAIYMTLYLIAKFLIIFFRSRALGQIPHDFSAKLFYILEIICFVVPCVLVPLHIFTAIYVSRHNSSFQKCDIHIQNKGVSHFFFAGQSKKIVWIFSLWLVMGWIQLIATSSIPIAISLLTDSFRSLAMFTIMASFIICALVCCAVIIHIYEHGPKHTKLIILMLLVLSGFGSLLILAFAVYLLVLTEEGLDANAVTGYIFSLAPVLILAAGAYVVDNNLLRYENKGDSSTENGDAEGARLGTNEKAL